MGVEAYSSLRLAADVVVMTTDNLPESNIRRVPKKGIQVMLIKRTEEPFKDMWVLPGAFVDHNKTLDDCVNNKVLSKIGIKKVYTEQLYTYGNKIDRDPRDRVVSVAYIALVNKEKVIQCNSKFECGWFWVKPIRNEKSVVDIGIYRSNLFENSVDIGFDHKDILIDAINRLASKLEYTDIGFNLLSDTFTIKELQCAYETILGKSLVGFRRQIEPKLEETGLTTSDTKPVQGGFRPAKLYRKRRI